MNESSLPSALQTALTTTTGGATGVARLAIDGLLELVDDRPTLFDAAALLRQHLPGYAPLWHIARAAAAKDPRTALHGLRGRLEVTVERSVATAVSWLEEHPGRIVVAPSSSVVKRVLVTAGPRAAEGPAAVGLAGADAIGETAVLNIRGTRAVAHTAPTLVVTGALKLVPEAVFADLHGHLFERVPLSELAAVVVDGDLLSPDEAGRRAAALETAG